jgi:serine/threonine-protein kinase
MTLEVGSVVDGKYRIVGLIGEGGMGAVFAGENIRIQRRVAIKVLHAAFTSNREVVLRFEREAQAAGRIGNDHIMEVLDLGTLPNGDLYLVMEFLDGEPLSGRLEALGRLRAEQAVPIILQVLVGLQAAHEAGIIHRDLKPDNIFLLKEKAGHRDYVKIIDFGISKFQPVGEEQAMQMTRTGTMIGTPYYMSPEQATGNSPVDARSDLYAVGVILYECVTGGVPFDAPSFNQLLFKIALSDPRPPQELVPELDPAFCALLNKSMAREPGLRFQSAQEFAAALDEWLRSGSAPNIGDSAAAHAAASSAPPLPDEEPKTPKSKRTLAIGLAVAIFAIGAVAAAAVFATSGDADVTEANAAPPTSAATIAPAMPTAAATDPITQRTVDSAPAEPATAASSGAEPPAEAPQAATLRIHESKGKQPTDSAGQGPPPPTPQPAAPAEPEPKPAPEEQRAAPPPEPPPPAPEPPRTPPPLDFGY